ncbi:MAG: hypothetical protein QXK74_08530 [Candidatus Nitrosocaldaceae archaeon]
MLYYIMMDVDTCQHRLITDRGEIVCNRCGRVFEKEEERVTRLEEIGWDPHGETSLFQTGLGSLELSRDLKEQDDISIISNIANKLELQQHLAIEFYNIYRQFVKGKRDRVVAAKLALIKLTRHKEVQNRIMRFVSDFCSSSLPNEYIKYIMSIVDNYFRNGSRRENIDILKLYTAYVTSQSFFRRITRIAEEKGAYKAVKCIEELIY